MKCYIPRCPNDAVTELRLRYQREGGAESDAVWVPLCTRHARSATEGLLPVLSQLRPVRWIAQRPLAEHEHEYRIKSLAPIRIGSAVVGYSDIVVCPCGDRRLAAHEAASHELHPLLPALG